MNVRQPLRRLLLAAAVAVPLFALPAAQAQFSIGVSFNIGIAPPALPVYAQPPAPATAISGPPATGPTATPAITGFPAPGSSLRSPAISGRPATGAMQGGFYGWHAGYWGPHIGFYGGVNYGFGYGGVGFYGGEWRGNHFFYNGAVVNYGGGWHPTNVYVDRDVVVHNTIVNVNHVSYQRPRRHRSPAHRAGTPVVQRAPHPAHLGPDAAPELRCPGPLAASLRQPRPPRHHGRRRPRSLSPGRAAAHRLAAHLRRRPLCRQDLQPQQS